MGVSPYCLGVVRVLLTLQAHDPLYSLFSENSDFHTKGLILYFYLHLTMSKLDKRIRLSIEETIDGILSGNISELEAQAILTEFGIEPDLERYLSFLIGAILGLTMAQSATLYGKPRKEDVKGVAELLSRRVMELRQYYLQTRYK